MTCKLCKKDVPLKNSHIIPEFIYSSLYDSKHRFYEISIDVNKKNKYQQQGVRERLLCDDCEQHLSKYERYASLLLNGGFELGFRKEGRLIHIDGIEYDSFKLFALSVLWRAGVSSIDVFDQVDLGHHEEKIRIMLLNKNPGQNFEYPFILSPIVHENEVLEGLIVKPTRTRLDNHYAYRFVFGGIVWVFVVSSHRSLKVIVNASIGPSGSLTMLPWKLSDMKFIIHMAQELGRQAKLDD